MIKPISQTCELSGCGGPDDYVVLVEPHKIEVGPECCDTGVEIWEEPEISDDAYEYKNGDLVGTGVGNSTLDFINFFEFRNRDYCVTVEIFVSAGDVTFFNGGGDLQFIDASGIYTFNSTGFHDLNFGSTGFVGSIRPIEWCLKNEIEVDLYEDCVLTGPLTPELSDGVYTVEAPCGQLAIQNLCDSGLLFARYDDFIDTHQSTLSSNIWTLTSGIGFGTIDWTGTAGVWYRVVFRAEDVEDTFGGNPFTTNVSDETGIVLQFDTDNDYEVYCKGSVEIVGICKIIGIKIYELGKRFTRKFCNVIPECISGEVKEVAYGDCGSLITLYLKSKLVFESYVDNDFELLVNSCACPTVVNSTTHKIIKWSVTELLPIDVVDCLVLAPKKQTFTIDGKSYSAFSGVPQLTVDADMNVSGFSYLLIACGETVKKC